MKTRIIIGRNPKADLVVPAEFAKVSGSHIVIEYRSGSYQMMDPGSRNGTQLNGTAINQNQFYQINPNDQIILGKQYQLKWNDVLQAFHTVTPQPSASQAEAPIAVAEEKEYSYEYAGFWARVAAMVFDYFILSPIFIAIIALVSMGLFKEFIRRPTEIEYSLPLFVLILIIGPIIGWIYFALMESSSYQATLGKQLMNLMVTDNELARISFGRATGRSFAKLISIIVPWLYGYIMAASHPEKKALHDVIAGTRIIRVKKNLRFPG